MTRRRFQLVAPHAGEIVANTARAMPTGTLLAAGGVLAGVYPLARRAAGGNRRADENRYGAAKRY